MKRLLLRPVSIPDILAWADTYHEATGRWPNKDSGGVAAARFETWLGVDAALRNGLRGLPGNGSLAQLLRNKRGVRNIRDLAPLTENQILEWGDKHHEATGA
jgi:hypothetical protein